jgi:hypothetical protein
MNASMIRPARSDKPHASRGHALRAITSTTTIRRDCISSVPPAMPVPSDAHDDHDRDHHYSNRRHGAKRWRGLEIASVFVAHKRNSIFEPLAKWDRYITGELLRGYREIAEGLIFGNRRSSRDAREAILTQGNFHKICGGESIHTHQFCRSHGEDRDGNQHT